MTSEAVSGWTVETLREYQRRESELLQRWLDERDRRVTDAFTARDQALAIVAELARDTKAQQNEWRATVNDVTAHKADAETVRIQLAAINDKIDALKDYMNVSRGAAAHSTSLAVRVGAAISAAVGLAGVILAVVAFATR